jgi:hypothetical protein
VKFESRVAEVFGSYRPEWSVQVISGGYWKHFAQGDRVLVFGEPDPANGSRRVRRGIVIDPPSPDIIRIDFGGEGHGEFSAADPVRVSHVAGTCPCVVVIS